MKNIHILPTDKPSRLIFNSLHKSFCYQKEIDGMYINDGKVSGADFWSLQKALNNGFKPQNIYITSDEEIKEGDWCYGLFNGGVVIRSEFDIPKNSQYYKEYGLKIILTTDQDLIKDGVQAIDDEFLEWFVKNPSCEEIKLNKYHQRGDVSGKWYYQIIIPKETPKTFKELFANTSIKPTTDKDGNIQYNFKATMKEEPKQETLEEVAERIYPTDCTNWSIKVPLNERKAFVEVAKWQQEVSQHIVPFDAYNIEVFKIEADENGVLFAYIGYRITNGNFHFSVVPFTEPQQNKNKYSEEEVLAIIFQKRMPYMTDTEIIEWFEQFKKK